MDRVITSAIYVDMQGRDRPLELVERHVEGEPLRYFVRQCGVDVGRSGGYLRLHGPHDAQAAFNHLVRLLQADVIDVQPLTRG